jgi:hypothetical protein
MAWNRIIAFLIELAGAGIFIWLWYSAGKTGHAHFGPGGVDRSQWRQGFNFMRGLFLVGAALLVAFGCYVVFAKHPFFAD